MLLLHQAHVSPTGIAPELLAQSLFYRARLMFFERSRYMKKTLNGATERLRTPDLTLTRRLLYQLS